MPRHTRPTAHDPSAPPPPLAPGYRTNLETIQRAARNADLCVVSARIRATGAPVAILAATYTDADGMICLVPLAQMFDANPYEYLADPTT